MIKSRKCLASGCRCCSGLLSEHSGRGGGGCLVTKPCALPLPTRPSASDTPITQMMTLSHPNNLQTVIGSGTYGFMVGWLANFKVGR